jgi:menaquinol-cytochrome c reductase iron-sulfur subunit
MTNCDGHEEPTEPTVLPDWKKVFVSREEFLKLLCLGLSGMIGLIVMVPGALFILNYLFLPKRPEWVSVGPVDQFKDGDTVRVGFKDPYILPWDGVSGKRSAWLRRVTEDDFTAFAINCTHLGCPVRWEDKADLFMCPCHGGVYYGNGDVAGGPPPAPLHRYPVRIASGQVQIQVGVALTEG